MQRAGSAVSGHARLAIAMAKKEAVWSETFIAAHLERLKELRLVLTDGRPPRLADGLPILVPASLGDRLSSLVQRRLLGTPAEALLLKRTAAALRRAGAQVLLCEYGNMGEAMVEASELSGVPLVAHFHGYDAHVHEAVAASGGYRRLFTHAAALVVVSTTMEDRLIDLGAPREKVKRIPYGIDIERFSAGDPAAAPPHFLAIGRFVDKKAPQLTLLAFSKLAAQRPAARLTMVGQGDLWETCRQMVSALGLEGRVELPGVLPPERIAELLRGSRAFVQHSVTTAIGDMEGTPLAVLEAMASGVPVVATAHAGIADAVQHGVSGLLCAERDADAMAGHLLRLADDPEAAGAMGRAGRAFVEEHHRIEDQIAKLQALLDGVVAR